MIAPPATTIAPPTRVGIVAAETDATKLLTRGAINGVAEPGIGAIVVILFRNAALSYELFARYILAYVYHGQQGESSETSIRKIVKYKAAALMKLQPQPYRDPGLRCRHPHTECGTRRQPSTMMRGQK